MRELERVRAIDGYGVLGVVSLRLFSRDDANVRVRGLGWRVGRRAQRKTPRRGRLRDVLCTTTWDGLAVGLGPIGVNLTPPTKEVGVQAVQRCFE